MANLNQMASYLAGEINKSDDHILKERIKYAIRFYRALLLRQDFQENGAMNNSLHSSRIKMKLVETKLEDLFIPNCKFGKTELVVPKPVRLKTPNPFEYVGNANGTIIFDYRNLPEFNYIQYNRFPTKQNYYTYINNHIYVLLKNIELDFIFINAYFENHEEVVELDVNSDACYNDDDNNYPLSADMEARILDILWNKLVSKVQSNKEVNITPDDLLPQQPQK